MAETKQSLLCRSGGVLCALPVEQVVETMRPLPLEAIPGMPAFVVGLTIARGAPIPVVLVNRLFGADDGTPGRLVVVRVDDRNGQRRVGLAFDDVISVHTLAPGALASLPPLLDQAPAEAASEIGALDGELLVLLQAARVVPEHVFAAIDAQAGHA